MPFALRIHDEPLSICRMDIHARIENSILEKPFSFLLHTKDELTLICQTAHAPPQAKKDGGWIILELAGPFELSATGILVQILEPLAKAEVSVFALSTFNTDYVLIKAEKRAAAIKALQQAGHRIQ